MPIDELDGTPEEYPDINRIPDFDERLDARQRLLLREIYKGLLDNLNGLKGFLHPIQFGLNLYSMVQHPITTAQRAATFAWENKIRALTSLGLNILEGQIIHAVVGGAISTTQSREMVFNNTTMIAAAESQLPAFLVEAEQLAVNVVGEAGHVCSGGVCTTLPASSSVSFFPAPIINSARADRREPVEAQLTNREPAAEPNPNKKPWYKSKKWMLLLA